MKKLLLSSVAVLLVNIALFAQSFENINAGLIQVYYTVTTWGDFDNDNDIDLLLAGEQSDATIITHLYNNDGDDNFSISNVTNIPPLEIGAVECADFNNDGHLDFVIQGYNGNTLAGYTKIFKNNGDGTFTELSTGLPQTYMGDVSWADIDNDNDPDLAISGFIDAAPYYISKIFKNNGDETFTEVPGTNFPGTMYGKFKWADYDNDGDMDFALTGFENDFVTEIYKNNGDGTFTNSGLDIHKGWLGDIEWADYNNDGNIDLVVSGTGGDGTQRYCLLYKNNGDGTFTELDPGFPGVSHSSLEWADFDLDGDLDLFICGTKDTPGNGSYVSTIFLNNGDDTFTESTSAQLPSVYWGESKVADYNGDGKPDILLSGLDDNENTYSAIFKNTTSGSSGYSVTFRVDMSNETVSPAGVHIAGSFQGWDPGATMMTDAGNDIFEYTQTFNEGEYIEYKFINGTQWGEDESVPAGCAQNNNRYFTVPATDTVLTAVCFGSCNPCGDQVTVTLRVDMSEQSISGDGVHVAGSFQGWDPAATEMTLLSNNIYTVDITANAYEQILFKFINGTSWDFVETVPEECGVPDGYGGFNRFFDVPNQDTILTAVCFGSCEPCATGLQETHVNSFELFPNPFNNKFTVKYSLPEAKNDVTIEVFNSLGEKVYGKIQNNLGGNVQTETISLAKLPAGVYLIVLKNNGIVLRKEKIVKQE